MWCVSLFVLDVVLTVKKPHGRNAQRFQKSLLNIVGFLEFLVIQLKGHFACNLGSIAKAICLAWTILVFKAKVSSLLRR